MSPGVSHSLSLGDFPLQLWDPSCGSPESWSWLRGNYLSLTENAGSLSLKRTRQKEKNTHRARNHRAYQPVVIRQTRIVQRTLGREEMNLREGGTHRAERRERGREGKARAAGQGPPWWEDGRRRGEAGLPVPSAAADLWKGRRRRWAGLGREAGGCQKFLGRRGVRPMSPNPFRPVPSPR